MESLPSFNFSSQEHQVPSKNITDKKSKDISKDTVSTSTNQSQEKLLSSIANAGAPLKTKKHIYTRNSNENSILDKILLKQVAKQPEERKLLENENELLSQVKKSLQNSTLSSQHKEQTLHFATHILSAFREYSISKGAAHTRNLQGEQILGSLLHLIDTEPEFIASQDFSKTKNTAQKITEKFFSILNQKLEDLLHISDIAQQQRDLRRQDIVETYLATMVADILITSDGTLNEALIPLLRKTLLHPIPTLDIAQTSVAKALKKYLLNPACTQELHNIKAPPTSNEQANTIIRTTCNLDRHEPITDRHARIAAFSATISNLRQNHFENCYVLGNLIVINKNATWSALKDFREIFEKECLTRTMQDIYGTERTIRFPGLLHTDMKRLKTSIEYDPNERTLVKESSRASFPLKTLEMEAVFKELGIPQEKLEPLLTEIITTAFPNRSFSLSDLIEKLIDHEFKGEPDEIKEEFFNAACIAHESKVENPVLRIWQNCVGAMEHSPISARGINLHRATIDNVATKIASKLGYEEDELMEVCDGVVHNFPIERFVHLFDPAAPGTGTDAPGSHILHWINDDGSLRKIHNRDEAKQLLQDALLATKQNIANSQELKESTKAAIYRVLDNIIDKQMDILMNRIDELFYEDLKGYPDNFWKSRLDGSGTQSLSTYWELNTPTALPKTEVTSGGTTSAEFETQIERIALYASQATKNRKDKVHVPFIDPKHYFILLANHPTLPQQKISDEIEAKAWTQNFIQKSNDFYTNTMTVSPKTIDKLVNHAIQILRFPETLKDELEHSLSTCLTFRECIQKYIEAIQTHTVNLETIEDLEFFDSVLLQLIDIEDRKQILENGAVIFGDINSSLRRYEDNVFYKDDRLCGYIVNPRDGRLYFANVSPIKHYIEVNLNPYPLETKFSSPQLPTSYIEKTSLYENDIYLRKTELHQAKKFQALHENLIDAYLIYEELEKQLNSTKEKLALEYKQLCTIAHPLSEQKIHNNEIDAKTSAIKECLFTLEKAFTQLEGMPEKKQAISTLKENALFLINSSQKLHKQTAIDQWNKTCDIWLQFFDLYSEQEEIKKKLGHIKDDIDAYKPQSDLPKEEIAEKPAESKKSEISLVTTTLASTEQILDDAYHIAADEQKKLSRLKNNI